MRKFQVRKHCLAAGLHTYMPYERLPIIIFHANGEAHGFKMILKPL